MLGEVRMIPLVRVATADAAGIGVAGANETVVNVQVRMRAASTGSIMRISPYRRPVFLK